MKKAIFIYCTILLSISYNTFSQTFSYDENLLKETALDCNDSTNINKYFEFFGVKISKFYKIIDYATFENIQNNKFYKLVILSPYEQEETIVRSDCDIFKTKRLLLILENNKDNKYSIFDVIENIILNTFDSQSEPYRRGMLIEKNSFTLRFYFGSKIRCYLNLKFTIYNSKFYLTQMYSDCYDIHDLSNSKKKTINFKKRDKFEISRINIHNLIDVIEKPND
jgi:hypothetical protein